MAREVGWAGFSYPGYVVPQCGCFIHPCYHDQKLITYAELRAAHALPLASRMEKIMSTTANSPTEPGSWLVRHARGNTTRTYGPFATHELAHRYGLAAFGEREYTTCGLLRPASKEETMGTLMEFARRVADGEDHRMTLDELGRALKLHLAALECG